MSYSLVSYRRSLLTPTSSNTTSTTIATSTNTSYSISIVASMYIQYDTNYA